MSLRLLPGVTRIWRLVMGLFEDTKISFISYETDCRNQPLVICALSALYIQGVVGLENNRDH
jgi:hypothetical protein